VRNCVVFGCLAAILTMAQEKTAAQPVRESLVRGATPTRGRGVPVQYAPDDVKILGDLDYGQTSGLAPYTANPRYRAFVFSGYGGETVEVTVKSADRKAFVAITDPSLSQIASGGSHLIVRLPYRGPDIEVWYIIFKDSNNRPARFTVQVKKMGDVSQKVRSEASPGY